MRSLKLEPDALSVESFEPAPRGEIPRGTVRGYGTEAGNNSCLAVCTNAGCSDGCSGHLTCNAASCATQCGETGGDWTYPPMITCDEYQNTCAPDCMV